MDKDLEEEKSVSHMDVWERTIQKQEKLSPKPSDGKMPEWFERGER